MNTRPTPLEVNIERKSDKLAVVNLTLTKAEAEACGRCGVCRIKPGPTKGRVTCANEMPASAVAGFLWGTRVDWTTTTPTPAPDEAPEPAGPRTPWRRRKKSIDDVAADQVTALATQLAFEFIDEDDGDPDAADAALDRRKRRIGNATGRLEDAVLRPMRTSIGTVPRSSASRPKTISSS